MRILITGATGFIGGHLAKKLQQNGHNLRCLVRQSSNLSSLAGLPIEYVHGDLFTQNILCDAVKDVDYVYHVAGVTKAKTKDEYFRGNQLATRNLLEAVRSVKPNLKRFVHVSSQAAVGPSVNGTIDETTPFHPITTYGVSKMEAERECMRVMDEIPITIIRPPAVYGPGDKDIFEFFKTMNKGLQPMIGFNNKEVSLIHVKDLVDGIVLAGESGNSVGQTYFISSENFYNWKEVGEITSRVMGRKVIRLRIPEPLVYTIAGIAEVYSILSRRAVLLNWEKAKDIVQDAWTCSIAKAKKELGYKESLTLEQGIADTVGWYREHGWL
jgi:dihydroflavonol-4-reductase